MPYVNIQITRCPLTRSQKAKIVIEITEAFCTPARATCRSIYTRHPGDRGRELTLCRPVARPVPSWAVGVDRNAARRRYDKCRTAAAARARLMLHRTQVESSVRRTRRLSRRGLPARTAEVARGLGPGAEAARHHIGDHRAHIGLLRRRIVRPRVIARDRRRPAAFAARAASSETCAA